MSGLVIGKKYADGWGVVHEIGGVTKENPDWVRTIQGKWYRQTYGRKIAYVLVDKTRPDGSRRHVPAEKSTYWDLRIG